MDKTNLEFKTHVNLNSLESIELENICNSYGMVDKQEFQNICKRLFSPDWK